jgi:hypothetical protein
MVAVLPPTLNGTWKLISVPESKITGAGVPLTSTDTPLQVVGTGLAPAQSLNVDAPPRFEPTMFATMPGAIGPDNWDAALTTEVLVNDGICACAATARREVEIVMPISDVRNGYSISN